MGSDETWLIGRQFGWRGGCRWAARAGARSGMMGELIRPSRRRCPVRVPRECYQLEETVAAHLPPLRPAQRLGLALWVYGAVAAGSAVPGGGDRGAAAAGGGPPRAAPGACANGCTPGDRAPPAGTELDGARLLRPAAARGGGVVAGDRPGAGGRRHQPGRPAGRAERQRALPRLRHPRRLARGARRPARAPGWRRSWPLLDRLAPGGARRVDGAGAEPIAACGAPGCSTALAALRLAPAAAPAGRSHLPPGRAAHARGRARRWCRDPATPGSGPASPSRTGRTAAPARCWWSGTAGRPSRGCC